jgi:oligopeptide/dipeptide ABC transporter ATP-binding protein
VTELLEVAGLDVDYGHGRVVRDVSLTVRRGDVLGLVGESGCGKTTLGLSILGLLPEEATVRGEVRFEGHDVVTMSKREKRRLLGDRVTTVPQSSLSSLDPVYTIGDQMIESFRAHRDLSRAEARELALEWLRRVGVPAPERRLRAYPHELSGGMRQRIAIATALALDPALLVADEPTSALDVSIQAQILRLLRTLISEHAGGVVLITHDLGVVAQLCNRVAVMYAGRIVEEAPVERLFADAQHPYTRALLDAHPGRMAPGERLTTIPGFVPDPAAMPEGCAFRPRCPVAAPGSECEPPWVEVGPGHHVRCVIPTQAAEAVAYAAARGR